MKILKRSLLVFLVIGCGQLVQASTGGDGNKKSSEGSVHGNVKDAVTKKPVPGTSVSGSTNRLQNIREILSDDCGYFHFSKLPPGEVTLMFEKKGYKVQKRDVPSGKGTLNVAAEAGRAEETGGNESWHPLLKLLD